MSRFIRWQGIAVFATLVALMCAFVYLFAGTLVKKGIITAAESSFGAEVNIDHVDVNFSPVSITINGMQVTDKEAPNLNLFSFEQAKASVDVWQYLFGKIIIEAFAVEQLKLNEKRAKTGAVYVLAEPDSNEGSSLSDQLPDFDLTLPDSKTLLANSNLHTVKAAEQLELTYQQEQEKLKSLKDSLPSKAKLKAYQERVKALTDREIKSLDDLEQLKADFDKVKASFKEDQLAVKKAKEQFNESKTKISSQLNALKVAPEKDWQEIENKYQLGSIDAEDFAHILFGEKARDYYQSLEHIYNLLSPYIKGNSSTEALEEKQFIQGRFISFKEDNPLPDFLLKQGTLSLELPQGDFSVTLNEITHQHWYRNKASEVLVSSKVKGQVTLESEFTIAQEGTFNSKGEWSISGLNIPQSEIANSKALTLNLTSGLLAGVGSYSVLNSELVSDANLQITQANYDGKAETKFTKVMLETLNTLDSLDLGIKASGDILAPSLSMSSSLDKALSGAVKQQVANKLSSFKSGISTGLNSKVSEALDLNSANADEMINFESILTNTDQSLEELKNSDVIKQQQDKLKDKAEDKLKKKLGKLFG
ncbi:TIGR03545 family protein [Colwellia sp. RSH04]|uniref:TIGR03545 family protein n=1 Tax=Colwellia sp. RSH04 TaxID=2305464 RepID=UPI000E57EA63|nr:TIGR03545 family protein [Colwellia sp. RSH04]RHW75149.1 TIGR03545 family protein [Colwellia sp. RSH04]